ncbi:MAG: hypothetical protein V1873_04790 [Verrucomicrobiota bacterium]
MDKPGRLPILLSAAYPGLGQFAQRRWGAAIAYVTSVTVFVIALAVSVLGPLFHDLRAVVSTDFMTGAEEPLEQVSMPAVAIFFFLALLVWVLNLVDVSRANRRRAPIEPPPL